MQPGLHRATNNRVNCSRLFDHLHLKVRLDTQNLSWRWKKLLAAQMRQQSAAVAHGRVACFPPRPAQSQGPQARALPSPNQSTPDEHTPKTKPKHTAKENNDGKTRRPDECQSSQAASCSEGWHLVELPHCCLPLRQSMHSRASPQKNRVAGSPDSIALKTMT